VSYLELAKQAEARLRAAHQTRQPHEANEVGDRRSVAEALPFLGMSLDEYQACGACLEVRVSWLDVSLWIVPTEREAQALFLDGVGRGRGWTTSELVNLMSVESRTPQIAKTIALAKLEMDGDIVSVRRRE
jgi:hypothetical protein